MSMTEKHLSDDMFKPAEIDAAKTEEIATPSTGFWKDAMRRLFKNKGAVFGLICIIFFIVMAIFGPSMNKYGYKDQDLTRQFLPPKIAVLDNVHWLPFDGIEDGADKYQLQGVKENFWLGTDQFGRDQWTRIWQGTRISLFIAFVAAAIDYLVGVAYGGISGYFGGKTDNIMQRIIEVVMGIPNLVIIILIMIILQPGITAIIIAMIITGWVNMARIVRGQILKLKGEEFVLASRTLGASHKRLITKHMIPNTAGQMIVTTMFTIPTAIFFEAFLSFVGLGLQPPIASLGTLINDGFQSLQVHPYLVIWPGIVISLVLISFNLLGDGLRDAFDPRMRGRG
jgi:oligopeptide transport system permease protein